MIYESGVLGATFCETWEEKQRVMTAMVQSVRIGYHVRALELPKGDPWYAKGYRWQVDRVKG